ncbi:MAG TPA: hypothetical protein VL485_20490 [Ktedonobacteraceae bacterium]|nr:hypothetical protein [Ktedonobacteraceae bacterium]
MAGERVGKGGTPRLRAGWVERVPGRHSVPPWRPYAWGAIVRVQAMQPGISPLP